MSCQWQIHQRRRRAMSRQCHQQLVLHHQQQLLPIILQQQQLCFHLIKRRNRLMKSPRKISIHRLIQWQPLQQPRQQQRTTSRSTIEQNTAKNAGESSNANDRRRERKTLFFFFQTQYSWIDRNRKRICQRSRVDCRGNWRNKIVDFRLSHQAPFVFTRVTWMWLKMIKRLKNPLD